jgi:TRAP-type C4-dicarboxylate transport system permease small subunit
MAKIVLIVGIAAAFLAAFFFLIWFGFSDFHRPVADQLEILEVKPWRPWARLIFSVVMLGILVAMAGLLLRAASQQRE